MHLLFGTWKQVDAGQAMAHEVFRMPFASCAFPARSLLRFDAVNRAYIHD
jgi:hypothetical protein